MGDSVFAKQKSAKYVCRQQMEIHPMHQCQDAFLNGFVFICALSKASHPSICVYIHNTKCIPRNDIYIYIRYTIYVYIYLYIYILIYCKVLKSSHLSFPCQDMKAVHLKEM